MRYAISYVSTSAPNLSREDISALFEKTIKVNNSENISGFLIYSNDNFFQFMEGEKEKIIRLYSRIENDPRHTNVIKFIEKPVAVTSSSNDIGNFKAVNIKHNDFEIKVFQNYLQVLDPKARETAERVMETILI